MRDVVGRLGVVRVDHVAVAVRSIEAALPLFRDLLGGEFLHGGNEPEPLGIRTIQLAMPNDLRIELLQPCTPDSYLHAVLDKRGEGVHHITVFVADIHGALAALEEAGIETVDTDLETDPAWLQTYVRPRSGFGIVWQIVQSADDWSVPQGTAPLEAVLAGGVDWATNRVARSDGDAGRTPS